MQSLTNINRGICQGIVTGDIYCPTDTVAIITLKVKDSRVNPVSGEKKKHYVQFTAFDEVAELVKDNAQTGQIIYVEYQLTSSKKMDENGVSKFYKNRVIENIVFGEVLQPDAQTSVPYQNIGFVQGEFVSLKRVEKVKGIAYLTVRIHMTADNGKEFVFYPQFTVFGGLIDVVENKYEPDSLVHVTYKIETDVKADAEGNKIYYTDYIANRIV